MAGAYCKFCGHRCFVYRIVPGGPSKGWAGHLATCPHGMEHDRKSTGGYDHTNTINPVVDVCHCGELLAAPGDVQCLTCEERDSLAAAEVDW